MAKSDEQVMEEFDEAVNMSASELKEWLQTEESREVGQKDGGGESRGTNRAAGSLRFSRRTGTTTPRTTSPT